MQCTATEHAGYSEAESVSQGMSKPYIFKLCTDQQSGHFEAVDNCLLHAVLASHDRAILIAHHYAVRIASYTRIPCTCYTRIPEHADTTERPVSF